MLRRLAPLLVLLCLPGHAPAQGKTFTLATEEELAATGLLKFVVPRFALKHGIRPEILTGDPATLAASADLVIAERSTALALVEAGTATGGRSVFHTEGDYGTAYAMALVPESAQLRPCHPLRRLAHRRNRPADRRQLREPTDSPASSPAPWPSRLPKPPNRPETRAKANAWRIITAAAATWSATETGWAASAPPPPLRPFARSQGGRTSSSPSGPPTRIPPSPRWMG